ncbi:CHAT domain-containing protein [Duganella sp. FT134W]|uniref:CHAT domain-containing protein n=1 Tax=Duganella margarita TaxID=2692170 RepID=A0A7X4H5Y8_9BURK|nr:CHAT domain-containing tetratricopeptide repeat protein [Duganella margarita]MYM75987.1 CHAT domain-containing protein [Duganella margarita]
MKRRLLACAAWLYVLAAGSPVAAQTAIPVMAPSAAPATGSCQPAAGELLAIGDKAFEQERYQDAVSSFEQALRLCRAAGDMRGISAALLEYGQTVHHLNRYADSEAALLEGWALRQKIDSSATPDGDPDREGVHYPAELMYLYRQSSRFDLAWQWGEIALRVKAKSEGTRTSSYGTLLSNLSGITLMTRDYARGLVYAKEAMDIWEHTSGTDSTDHAWGMRDVGVLLLRQGKQQEAYYYLERAYRIRLAAFGQDRTETQTSTQDMAAWYTEAGNDAAALTFAEQGLASAFRRFGPDAVNSTYALSRVSAIHLRLGEAAQAASEAEQVLRIRRATLGEHHAQTISAWQDVASTQLANNRLGRSAAAAQAGFDACRAMPGGIAASCVWLQLAHAKALLALGQAQVALDEAERAAAVARAAQGEHGGDERVAAMLRAQALLALGRYEQAESTLAELAQRVAALPDPMANGQTEVDLVLNAVRAERVGIDAQALSVLAERVGVLAQQLAGQRGLSHPTYANALLDAAALNARGPDLALARQQSARAMAIGLANRATLLQARAAAQLSALDDGNQAVFLGKQAVNALQLARENITGLPVEQQHSFVQLKQVAYQQLVDRLLDRRRIGEAESVLAMVEENEFHDLVRGADTSADGRQDARIARLGFDGADQLAQQQFTARAQALEQAAQALAKAREHQAQGSAGGAAELAKAQADMQRLLDAATAEWSAPNAAASAIAATSLAASSPAASAAVPDSTPDTVTRAALPAGRLQLTYLVSERRLRIVVQHDSVARVVTLDVDEAALAREIASLRRLAQDPGRDPLPQAQRLYNQLLAPVAQELAQARSLSLSLNGVLRYLPFAMLHDGRHWLVERLPLQVAGGADSNDVPATSNAPARTHSVALFGQSQATDDLPALPYVARELQAVSATERAGHIPSQTYLDASFTAATLERALQRDSMVHIASHFVLRSGRDDGSYLLLGNGQRLSVAELAQPRFRFTGLDLLTLSACETAVPAGVDATGRELASLAWLARERGARNVLASLWRVSDRSTATLMTDFYQALGRGASKPEALRQAQLRQIASAAATGAGRARGLKAIDAPAPASMPAGTHSHPFYWAGFTMLGN